MTAHLRIKPLLAASALVVTTSLMWSDTAISWWANIVSFFLRVNYDATTSVMSHRQNGDADLHAILWGITAVIVLIACSSRKQRVPATVLLGAWSIFVECAQPWFTDLRSRQATDLIGNAIGIFGAFIVFEAFAFQKRHN